jgi:hypothetical protein
MLVVALIKFCRPVFSISGDLPWAARDGNTRSSTWYLPVDDTLFRVEPVPINLRAAMLMAVL